MEWAFHAVEHVRPNQQPSIFVGLPHLLVPCHLIREVVRVLSCRGRTLVRGTHAALQTDGAEINLRLSV
jgi:hypothetical protein